MTRARQLRGTGPHFAPTGVRARGRCWTRHAPTRHALEVPAKTRRNGIQKHSATGCNETASGCHDTAIQENDQPFYESGLFPDKDVAVEGVETSECP